MGTVEYRNNCLCVIVYVCVLTHADNHLYYCSYAMNYIAFIFFHPVQSTLYTGDESNHQSICVLIEKVAILFFGVFCFLFIFLFFIYSENDSPNDEWQIYEALYSSITVSLLEFIQPNHIYTTVTNSSLFIIQIVHLSI